MLVKAVLLDWGGVISPGGTPDEVPIALSKVLGKSIEEATQLIAKVAHDLKRGKLSTDKFWEMVQIETGITIEPQDRNIWSSVETFKPNESILSLVKTLRADGIPVGVLSNVFPITAMQIHEKGWYKNFEPVILSTEAGYAKPDPEFYQIAIEKLSLDPSEILFIDDQQYCLDGAMKAGMQTHLASDPEGVLSCLQKWFYEAS